VLVQCSASVLVYTAKEGHTAGVCWFIWHVVLFLCRLMQGECQDVLSLCMLVEAGVCTVSEPSCTPVNKGPVQQHTGLLFWAPFVCGMLICA
jgi:hypothetical protein